MMMLLAQAKLVFVRASRATQVALRMFERRYEPSKYYMRGTARTNENQFGLS